MTVSVENNDNASVLVMSQPLASWYHSTCFVSIESSTILVGSSTTVPVVNCNTETLSSYI